MPTDTENVRLSGRPEVAGQRSKRRDWTLSGPRHCSITGAEFKKSAQTLIDIHHSALRYGFAGQYRSHSKTIIGGLRCHYEQSVELSKLVGYSVSGTPLH